LIVLNSVNDIGILHRSLLIVGEIISPRGRVPNTNPNIKVQFIFLNFFIQI